MVPAPDRQVILVGQGGALSSALAGPLERAGFGTVAVSTAADCIEALRCHQVAAVVSEYELPDLDGVHLHEALRLSGPGRAFVLWPEEAGALERGAVVGDGGVHVPGDAGAERVVQRLLEDVDTRGPGSGDQPAGSAGGAEGGPSDGDGRAGLEEGERRYRELIRTSPAPINLFDADGTAIWGNDAVLDLLELSDRADLVGRSIFEFIHPEDHEVARDELRRVVTTEVPTGPTQMELVAADGTVKQIQVSTAPGRLGGRSIGQAVVVDVTELVATREALDRERRLVERMVDAAEDVFYVLDRDGEIQRWNDRALAVTGHDAERLEELAIEDLVADADVEAARASIETAIESGRAVVEASLLTADGRAIPYEFRKRRLSDEEGTVVGVVGVGRDVTDRRERERQLQVLERLLRHNIRNDMSVVLGIAENLERGQVEDVAAAARTIHERAEHLVRQANKERELVGLVTEDPEPGAVDLGATVEAAVEETRRRHPGATVEVRAEAPPRVVAVERIGDALAELLDNAVRHNAAEEPWVRLTVERVGDTCEVRVADDGPGVPEVERTSIAAEDEVDHVRHGSGIGLLLVSWLVQRSGGGMTLEDRDPRGCVVTLRLPVVAE